jgi:hypothetical protein
MTTKVTLHDHASNTLAPAAGSPSPATDIIKAATQEHTITDGRGRQIVLRKPGALAQFRLVEAVGASARNEVYMGMATQLLYVTSINGNEVPPITTKPDLEALIQRLDEDGVEAVFKAVQEHYATVADGDEREALKK